MNNPPQKLKKENAPKKEIPFDEYMKKQIKEIHSDSNRQKTKEKVGHEPTDEELAEYYIEDGGAETFSEKYISK